MLALAILLLAADMAGSVGIVGSTAARSSGGLFIAGDSLGFLA